MSSFAWRGAKDCLALEPHLSDPHHSTILQKYPTRSSNHHVVGIHLWLDCAGDGWLGDAAAIARLARCGIEDHSKTNIMRRFRC